MTATAISDEPHSAWGAVWAMSLCAGLLVASEFLPVSLLTPLAQDLGVRPGAAGQAISISGLFAVLTSLISPWATRSFDRRTVQTAYAALMILSATIVSLAPNYLILMAGRALLGVAVGGFWYMSTAMIMRLLPERDVPRGLALLNVGVAFSTVISAPLGSWLGGVIGWRGTVFVLVPLAVMAACWLWFRMPAMPPRGLTTRANPLRLLLDRQSRLGMIAIFLIFAGNFSLFTYLRPYLESVVGLALPMISTAFLGLGLAGLAGSWLVGRLIPHAPWGTVIALPAAMAVVALLLIPAASQPGWVISLLCAWGLVATGAPVGWGAWVARTFGDRAEVAGGLQVATIQLAIMCGAALGGLVYDGIGWTATFGLSAFLLAGASIAAFATWRDGLSSRTP